MLRGSIALRALIVLRGFIALCALIVLRGFIALRALIVLRGFTARLDCAARLMGRGWPQGAGRAILPPKALFELT